MNLKNLYYSLVGLFCFINLSAQLPYEKIIVYRNEPVHEREDETYLIFANETLTTTLKNNTYQEFYMPGGSFTLQVSEVFPTKKDVACQYGRSYYYRINRNVNLTDKSITIVAVDSLAAANEIKYLKSTVAIKKNIIKFDRRNSFGVVFEPGVGFEKVGMLSTTVGTQVMHSFGGGVAFGLSYGYRFSDYFGFVSAFSKQFSVLSPRVTNASVVFDQGVFSTTPYFTIPLMKRYEQKIKLGVGLDYRFGADLEIETEKLEDGFNDIWKYKNAFGYHILAAYEWELGGNMRMHGGFKYNDARFSYVWSEQYTPLDPKLKSPHANSLSVSVGLEYLF